MYVGAEVYINPYNGYIGKKITKKGQRIFDEFHNKYKKYKRKSTSFLGAYNINKKENIEELFWFVVNNQEFLDFRVYLYPIYENKDYENADAFYLWFSLGGEYYDESEKHNSLIEVSTKGGGGIALKEPIKIKFTAKQKQKLKKEYIGYTGERYQDSFISFKLREYLIQNGVSEKYFKAVYDTKENIVAYRLWGQDNILPSQAITIDNFERYVDTDENIYYWDYPYDEDRTDKYFKKHNSIFFHTESLTLNKIKESVLKELEFVNETYEYTCFLGMRDTIVNRKFYELVKEVIPNADKYFVPLETV